MRWFKHMTDARNDEKLAALSDRFGLEGIGFYWTVLEIVAQKMDEKLETSASFSAKKWGSFAGISAKKFQNLAEFCASLGLFFVENDGNLITVNIPKLLNIKDEHTRKACKNSGVAPDNIRTNSRLDIELDIELDVEEEFNTPLTPLSGGAGEVEEDSPPCASASPAKKANHKAVQKPTPEQEFEQALQGYTASLPLQEAFKAYRDMRKAIKKPLTAPALSLAFKKLDSLAATDAEKVAVLEQSTLNSWQSLYELKQDKITASHVPKAFKSFAQQRLEANMAAAQAFVEGNF